VIAVLVALVAVVAVAALPSILVIPVRTSAPEARFNGIEVVPIYTFEFPKTVDDIVPERFPAVSDVKPEPLPDGDK
jgi:hypothetical protein